VLSTDVPETDPSSPATFLAVLDESCASGIELFCGVGAPSTSVTLDLEVGEGLAFVVGFDSFASPEEPFYGPPLTFSIERAE
jgi:hypothetical protein